ncbi:Zinc finger protein-like 1 [Amphibalanus amphitrite]|uniref:Zinc finger protein-like 1 homolog n=1 Tax=Amphibalanus amphitrite TaxID=1232801 RepID=A0A6A4W2F1_AMPAM|nr:zinc finger protein-like 1 homolog [Amphibalanus amphitrite]XP_043208456.1 zinc finger protein-like 1 homolog [Amphibalanus amphitrite]XP_043208457.1 zinc finger protein-like 1 homolog [Amphibalanus amphitrite]XP_043208459.1 zinc finger protein-like 1 homolog [Amphibalanus amphitrite]KAF0301436.1 Zinc finger protein-like 1 [Amphibalanus amphitrite]
MGLCKCSKRKVTNQFCFEHRVNVCEYCMVNNHPKCIVQSYLKWLEDSDCDPKCPLCKEDLKDHHCVRLTCYHVFHWSCLNAAALQLPANTAPAGYRCPCCPAPLFPPANMVSPVADVLREQLQKVNWARAGLGLPLLDTPASFSEPPPVEPAASVPTPTATPHAWEQEPPARKDSSVVQMESGSAFHRELSAAAAENRRFLEESRSLLDSDSSENKYRRRSALEWFQRWWRLMSGPPSRPRAGAIYRRYLMVLVLVVVALVTFVSAMRWLAAGTSSDDDPMFDPHFNPNIHVRE